MTTAGERIFVCNAAGCTNYRRTGKAYCGPCLDLKAGKTTGVGAGHGAKLTDEQRAEIRRRLGLFESPRSVARDLGITVQTVRRAMKAASG